jgi:CARDB
MKKSFIKKIYTKLWTGSLLISLSLGNLGCTKDAACNQSIIDLTAQIVVAAGSTIAAGVPFNLQTLIPCALNTVADCKDALTTATSSTGKITTSQKQASGQFTIIDNKDYGVPQIPAGSAAQTKVATTFNDPGEYQVITFADTKNMVSEFNENNNNSNVIGATARKKIQTILVLPNPNFTKSIGAPSVEVTIGETSIIKM